jgi:hypothetical protein
MGLFGCLRRQQGQSIKPAWIFFLFYFEKKRECLMEQQIMSLCTYNGAANTECGFS